MRKHFCLGLMVGALVIEGLVVQRSALGHQLIAGCWSDFTGGSKGTVAFQQDGVDPVPNPDRYLEWANGVKSDIEGGGARHCVRITSLFVINKNKFTNHVEFGWVLGYDPCSATWRATPIAFAAWQRDGEPQLHACFPNATTPDNAFRRFTLADENQDTVWYFTWAGNVLKTENMDFSDGLALANGERQNLDDLAAAHFTNLQYAGVGAFEPWTNLRELREIEYSFDPDYNCKKISNREAYVTTSTTTPCPLGSALN